MGAKAHPRSGAGKIKHDGSTAEQLIEVKTAAKSHNVTAKYVAELFKRATQQGKQAVYVIEIGDYLITGTIKRKG